MQRRVHPTFSKAYHQTMRFIWIGSLSSLGLGFWLLQREIAIGALFALGFVVFIAGGILRLRYRLQHVTCWECGGPTRTHADRDTSTSWLAVCEPCQITWDLQAESMNYT